MKKIFLLVLLPFLTACGVKDPSFYDLKSPCVSMSQDESDPCTRITPELNKLYDTISS